MQYAFDRERQYSRQKAIRRASYTAITLLSPTLKRENTLQIFQLHTCAAHKSVSYSPTGSRQETVGSRWICQPPESSSLPTDTFVTEAQRLHSLLPGEGLTVFIEV